MRDGNTHVFLMQHRFISVSYGRHTLKFPLTRPRPLSQDPGPMFLTPSCQINVRRGGSQEAFGCGAFRGETSVQMGRKVGIAQECQTSIDSPFLISCTIPVKCEDDPLRQIQDLEIHFDDISVEFHRGFAS